MLILNHYALKMELTGRICFGYPLSKEPTNGECFHFYSLAFSAKMKTELSTRAYYVIVAAHRKCSFKGAVLTECDFVKR